MILDKQMTLADQQSLVLGLGLATLSTNSIDLGVTGTIPSLGGSPVADVGRGAQKALLVQITETVASGGAAELKFNVVTGTGVDAGGQINAGKKVHNSSRAYALADLKAGKQIEVAILPGIDQRYLAIEVTNAVAATTAGKMTAGIVLDRQTNPSV